MPTLAELRGARRRDAEATAHVHAAHREALNCYKDTDRNCMCDCGHVRSDHAMEMSKLSPPGFVFSKGECIECSCVRFTAVDSFRCEYCGNDVRVGRDADHCNDCLILEVDNCRELAT